MIFHRTTAYCNSCQTDHPAVFMRVDGRVVARTDCPRGVQEMMISNDPDMYFKIRERSHTDLAGDPPRHPRHILNYISITNACNFNCSVCGADARPPGQAVYLTKAEILRRARRVAQAGGKILHLIGGEPTLHPDLLDIVGALARMGLSVGLATNGYLLGRSADMAVNLKSAGLRRVCLQFDSLKRDTLQRYGRDALDEKHGAIENALRAGLKVSLNCTVTEGNLDELSQLLTRGLTMGAGLVNLTFATAAPTGRFTIDNQRPVCREQVIGAFLKAGSAFDFSLDDFYPLPTFLPWRMAIHPDCGVHLPFVRTPRGIFPLNRLVDIGRLYHAMSQCRPDLNPFNRLVLPILLVARSIRWRRILKSAKIGLGLMFGKDRYSVVNVSTTDYRAAMFMDRQRINRCATVFHASIGPVSGCVHFFSDQRVPGSRLFEIENGFC